MRIVFMGTPEFAVPPLDILVKSGYDIAAVVTAPDKPAGRGQKPVQSAVKKYALKKELYLLQPENLKDNGFVNELRSLKPHLQVVVAFRMLPEVVWSLPEKGTFNLHASLLPQYRGAAPINHAILNGETETGITTFFLDNKIDTGTIILQDKVHIGPDETAGELHDKLMEKGSRLVLLTVEAIAQNRYTLKRQEDMSPSGIEIKKAPKIYKEDCRINWGKNTSDVYNLIRGLSPYPAAFTELHDREGNRVHLRIFQADPIYQKPEDAEAGDVISDNKNYLKIITSDGAINIISLQQSGKRRMPVEDFLRGFKLNNEWKAK
ncbi:MAG: methionyl-tRNA formyltransferase [Bacteroidales bacterium]|nr:methionyl-tRNA formyltransferase [Bacteroidales bacterium]